MGRNHKGTNPGRKGKTSQYGSHGRVKLLGTALFASCPRSTRSELSNRKLAVERFVELLQSALRILPMRKYTRVSKVTKRRRLEDRAQRSVIKHWIQGHGGGLKEAG